MANKLSDVLIVSDVDGTILEAGYGIPKLNLEAIDAFIANGGNFTIATGRGIDSVGYYTNMIKLTMPAILCNGGIVYDYKSEQLIYEQTLQPEVVDIVSDIAKHFSDVGIIIMKQKENYAIKMNKYATDLFTVEHLTYTVTDITAVPSGWNKVLFAADQSYTDKVEQYFNEKYLNSKFSEIYSFSRTNELYYEIMPKSSTKENALLKLCEMQGFDIKNVVTIGNYYSDVCMFEASGFSVAVDNAPEEVKNKAKLVVSSCLKGGVSEAIKYIETNYKELFN